MYVCMYINTQVPRSTRVAMQRTLFRNHKKLSHHSNNPNSPNSPGLKSDTDGRGIGEGGDKGGSSNQQRDSSSSSSTGGLKSLQKPSKPKIGCLQEYIAYDDNAGNMSSRCFPIFEVQKIALLDIRLINLDRNEENVLFRRDEADGYHLIPIDHSYSLPDRLQLCSFDWCWMGWKQAKQPICQEIIE